MVEVSQVVRLSISFVEPLLTRLVQVCDACRGVLVLGRRHWQFDCHRRVRLQSPTPLNAANPSSQPEITSDGVEHIRGNCELDSHLLRHWFWHWVRPPLDAALLVGLAYPSPLFFAPVSEVVGRTPMYAVSMFFYFIFTLPSALAKNAATLVVARQLAGLAASAPMCNVGGT